MTERKFFCDQFVAKNHKKDILIQFTQSDWLEYFLRRGDLEGLFWDSEVQFLWLSHYKIYFFDIGICLLIISTREMEEL